MASSARIDEIKKKFDENPRRYFAPLANEFRKAGDLEQAILICEEFLPQQAGHMSGHIVYGQALFESGRLPESRTVFETALGLDPENLIALRHLGDIARADGDPAGARRWYERVLEADPRNEEIQALLAGLDAEGHGGSAAAVAEPAAELAIDLDMDDAAFAAPPAPAADSAAFAAPAPTAEPVTSPAPPLLDLPVSASHAPSGRAEGLEPSEFEAPSTSPARAEGLEPAEFEAPSGYSMRAEGLETTEFTAPPPPSTDNSLLDLEGSFDLPMSSVSAGVAPLAGLEEAGPAHPPAADEPSLPSLDLDDGLAVPGAAVPAADVPLGEAAPPGAANPRLEPPAAMEAMSALDLGEVTAEGATAEPMMELPPSVIAAESTLMDAGLDLDATPADDARAASAGRQAPFVTETMAELYLSQGFHAQALDVYRQLSAASPHDARLRERVATLERGDDGDTSASADASGPSVREFLFRLATRRPGESGAATQPPAMSDFASFDAIPAEPVAEAPVREASVDEAPLDEASARHPWDLPAAPDEPSDESPPSDAPLPFMDTSEPEPSASPESSGAVLPTGVPFLDAEPEPDSAAAPPPMPTPSERATTAQGGSGTTAPSGTIDALFGTRPAATSEDSAASALAQAFGGSTEAPAITGRPARAASAELSLDSVFRDGPPRPPRPSQSFSFDQFFSEGASDAAAGKPPLDAEDGPAGGPAERSADDVKQFNSWLQGLKPQ